MPRTPRPIPNRAALLIPAAKRGDRATVVIADLHLGLGANAERPAGPPEATSGALAGELIDLCTHEHAGRLVIAGDIKHPIVGAPPWLRPVLFEFFAELLRAGLGADVVLGNHDVGLERHLPREVTVSPATGAVVEGVGIFHGHRWPSEEVLAARTLVAGHLHPGYRFAPSPTHPDGKHRCWVRVEFPPRPPSQRRPPPRTILGNELIVLPAFHPLAGAESLNRERPRRSRSFLFGRFLSKGIARAYLLDGAGLGVVPTVADGRAPGSRKAPPRT